MPELYDSLRAMTCEQAVQTSNNSLIISGLKDSASRMVYVRKRNHTNLFSHSPRQAAW